MRVTHVGNHVHVRRREDVLAEVHRILELLLTHLGIRIRSALNNCNEDINKMATNRR